MGRESERKMMRGDAQLARLIREKGTQVGPINNGRGGGGGGWK